jgi:signal transduction histidine kinase
VVLDVTDDGRGFTETDQLIAPRSGHIGLAASKERVEATGGSFHVETALGAGSRIRCVLPAIDDAAKNASLARSGADGKSADDAAYRLAATALSGCLAVNVA